MAIYRGSGTTTGASLIGVGEVTITGGTIDNTVIGGTTPTTGTFTTCTATSFSGDGSGLTNVSTVIDLTDLGDVDTTGVANKDILIYNSTSGDFEPGTELGSYTATTQPSFRATASAWTPTADAIVVYSTEDHDTGGDYDNTTYTFTVPTTGVYQINASLQINSYTSGLYYLELQVNESEIHQVYANSGAVDYFSLQISEAIKLTEDDTVRLNLNGQAASFTITASGTFSMCLLG